jgi:hypothetical protein
MEQLTDGHSDFEPLRDTGFASEIHRVVMPLFTMREANFVSIGTGFVISGDGVMITARHVVEEVIANSRRVLVNGRWTDATEFYALYATAERHGLNQENLGGLWPIERVWLNPDTDIAFCWLRGVFATENG